jgi:hydrogenase expression/formation protein HypD
VQAFLAAGHVCAVMGLSEYEELTRRWPTPIVVTGFEPVDILQGILMAVRQLEEGRVAVENQYKRAVRPDGNLLARQTMREVFETADQKWRGLGEIPMSGLKLRAEFEQFDASKKFDVGGIIAQEDPECQSGLVLQGALTPDKCPAFGVKCTPEHPLGAPMVSAEGACSAYYRYRSRG